MRRPLVAAVLLLTSSLAVFRWARPPEPPARFQRDVSLSGRLDRPAEARDADIRFVFRDESGARWQVAQRGGSAVPAWGDRVRVDGRATSPRVATVPGAYDETRLFGDKGVHGRIAASSVAIEPGRGFFLTRWADHVRRRFFDVYDRHLSPRSAALLKGVVLGRKPVDFPDLDQDFRRSGMYHLLVASGSNVGFAVGIWFVIGRWLLRLPRQWLWACASPCAFFYAALAGWDPPVVRAAVMFTIGVAGLLLAREDRLEHAIALSALVLLAIHPPFLFQAGFQMSYAATLGVVMGASSVEKLLGVKKTWARWILALVSSSACSQLALAPLLLHYFGRLAWIGLIANLIAVPWTALCLTLGVVLFGADVAFGGRGPVMNVFAWSSEGAARVLEAVARVFGCLPGEWMPAWNETRTAWLWIGVLATFVALRAMATRREEGSPIGRAWPSVLGAAWLVSAAGLFGFSDVKRVDGFAVAWLESGWDSSIVVHGPEGGLAVVGPGRASGIAYRVVPYVRWNGVAAIDLVIVTDERNADGMFALLNERRVRSIVAPDEIWLSTAWARVRETAAAADIVQKHLTENEFDAMGARWRPHRGADGWGFALQSGERSVWLASGRRPPAPPSHTFDVADITRRPLSRKAPRPQAGRYVLSGRRATRAAEGFSPLWVTGVHGTLLWRAPDNALSAYDGRSFSVAPPLSTAPSK